MITQKRSTLLFGLLIVVVLITFAYAPVVQTIPNGAEHPTMIDVGETQIVLNVWGTLHATGYPLYVMVSSALVAVLRAIGVNAAAAPAITSLIWGVLALILVYALAARLTSPPLGMLMTVAFGLTRMVWLHHTIAEIYTFGLMLLALLFVIALWDAPIKNRLFWLALIGGFAVAHHRAIALAAPALLFSALADLRTASTHHGRFKPIKLLMTLIGCVLIGLIGFIPYVYLPLRANANAAWVYGDPDTLQGLWDQFSGREAARFIGGVSSLEGLGANFELVNGVIVTDMSLPAVLIGVIGLAWGIMRPNTRRAAITLTLSGLAAYAFHVLFYTDVLAALILSVEMSLAFGWLFFAYGIVQVSRVDRRVIWALVGSATAIYAAFLFSTHRDFILSLTTDESAQENIAYLQDAPENSTLMIAWGPRHFAAGFARDVMGIRPDVSLVDHTVDYTAASTLVTPSYTFYTFPLEWWEDRLGTRFYLNAVAPRLVWFDVDGRRGGVRYMPLSNPGIYPINTTVQCRAAWIDLAVEWWASAQQREDLSVFVHLVDANGAILDQDDQFAPVYGLRPLTTWFEREIVRDVYTLDRYPNAVAIRFGMYRQLADGSFQNVIEREIANPLRCNG